MDPRSNIERAILFARKNSDQVPWAGHLVGSLRWQHLDDSNSRRDSSLSITPTLRPPTKICPRFHRLQYNTEEKVWVVLFY